MKPVTGSSKAKPPACGTPVVPFGRDELHRRPGSYLPEVIAIEKLRVKFVLRQGLKALPEHPALRFELGRIYLKNSQDVARARNTWRHTAKTWRKQEESKTAPDNFVLEQILTHLAKLEEDAGNLSPAINYWEQANAFLPERKGIPERIQELRQKLAPAPVAR